MFLIVSNFLTSSSLTICDFNKKKGYTYRLVDRFKCLALDISFEILQLKYKMFPVNQSISFGTIPSS